jgi:Ca2+-binding EF-hand superfamily protein
MKPQVFVLGILLSVPAGAIGAPHGDQSDQAQRRQQMRFQAMDRNGDGVISRSEWRGSDQSFNVHDWNGDGVLSGDEVRVGANRQGDEREDDFDQNRRPEFRNWTDRGFENVDRNGDGRITRSEWIYDREGFIRADRNGDGVLTRSEFLGNDVDSDREDRFDFLDANNNGRVERSEWHGSRDTFEWLDRNNDGVLSRSEVVGADSDESDLFGALDTNNDNVITTSEWRWSRRSFAQQDRNGDGQLTRDELTNAELSRANAPAVGTSGRSFVVDATRGWVDTGLNVRSGDRLAIDANGTVTLSDNNADVAGPGGSQSGRRAPSAPLPNQPAGALIARIGDSGPMFLGNRQVVTSNDTGRLYLAVNDDYFNDNRGQFQVTISIQR